MKYLIKQERFFTGLTLAPAISEIGPEEPLLELTDRQFLDFIAAQMNFYNWQQKLRELSEAWEVSPKEDVSTQKDVSTIIPLDHAFLPPESMTFVKEL